MLQSSGDKRTKEADGPLEPSVAQREGMAPAPKEQEQVLVNRERMVTTEGCHDTVESSNFCGCRDSKQPHSRTASASPECSKYTLLNAEDTECPECASFDRGQTRCTSFPATCTSWKENVPFVWSYAFAGRQVKESRGHQLDENTLLVQKPNEHNNSESNSSGSGGSPCRESDACSVCSPVGPSAWQAAGAQ